MNEPTNELHPGQTVAIDEQYSGVVLSAPSGSAEGTAITAIVEPPKPFVDIPLEEADVVMAYIRAIPEVHGSANYRSCCQAELSPEEAHVPHCPTIQKPKG